MGEKRIWYAMVLFEKVAKSVKKRYVESGIGDDSIRPSIHHSWASQMKSTRKKFREIENEEWMLKSAKIENK